MNAEKVINGIERGLVCSISVVASKEAQNAYRDCEYTVGLYCGQKALLHDAVTLLKEHEAIEPILVREGRNKHYNNYVCPRCDNDVFYEQNYCTECGAQFLWEGR